MFWKLVLGSMLLAAIVDCKRNRCKRATEKMDDCLLNGYKFRDCVVFTGQLTTEQTEKCEWLAEKIERKCPDYTCESESTESGWTPIFNETSTRYEVWLNTDFKTKFTPLKVVNTILYLQTRMTVYNDADEAIGISDVIFQPGPGPNLLVEFNLNLLGRRCGSKQYMDDLADMDFTFTITMGDGASMFKFEASSGKMITADLSKCNIIQSWQEMIENEAISADVLFSVDPYSDVEDYFTTKYKIDLS